MDDSILSGPYRKEIDKIIKNTKKEKLNITIKGDLQDFLGVKIERKSDGSIHLTQPHLIYQILKYVKFKDERVNTKPTLASSLVLLLQHNNPEAHESSFNYFSVIGKLNYMERATRGNIYYITHQCARFTGDPKVEHAKAILWLG